MIVRKRKRTFCIDIFTTTISFRNFFRPESGRVLQSAEAERSEEDQCSDDNDEPPNQHVEAETEGMVSLFALANMIRGR